MTGETAKHNVRVLLSGAALLAALTWIVTQVNLLPVTPGGYAAMWGVIAAALPVLGLYWAGAMGLGAAAQRLLLRGARPVTVVAAGLGLALMLLAAWCLAWAGGLNRVTAWALPGVGAAWWVVQLVRRHDAWRVRLGWEVLWIVPGAALLLVAAACPPGSVWRTEVFGYDVLSYHLQVPREWLAAGRMQGLEHNVYSYLPGLFEAGYLHLAAMRGSMREAIYLSQLLHASAALLAAAGVGGAVSNAAVKKARGWLSPGFKGAGLMTAGVFLVVPWVVVTGSLAYNEMGVMGFGAVALMMALWREEEPPEQPPAEAGANGGMQARRGVVVGLLCGAATLCKLTAGPMVAVPIGVMMLMRKQVKSALVAGVVGLAVLSPYLVRNAVWTGNPVFPFATGVLGQGHWDDELAARWDRGHGLGGDEPTSRGNGLVRQWLLNTGYGAIGGKATPREVENIARFAAEGGVPVLWIAVLIAGGLAVWRKAGRDVVAQLAVVLVIQVGFWLVATHLQSRFLIPTLLPTVVVLGLGLAAIERQAAARWAGGLLIAGIWIISFVTLLDQTLAVTEPNTGRRVNLPPGALVAALDDFDDPAIDQHVPPGGKVYLVADNSRLLYVDRAMVYHSAFDASPLGAMIRQHDGDPRAVNAALRGMGVTHVWVHWSELDRLHNTYGYDEAVTRAALRRLIDSGWRLAWSHGDVAALYALPTEAD